MRGGILGCGVQIGENDVEGTGAWVLNGLPGRSQESIRVAESNARERKVGPWEPLKTGFGP